MKRKFSENLILYAASAGVGIGMTVSMLKSYGFSDAAGEADRYRILADAFTVPGVVIFLLGVLAALADEGVFEGVNYAVIYSVKLLIPGIVQEQESYGDYIVRRRERGKLGGYGFLYATGGLFLFAAVVFVGLYYAAG